MLPQVRGGAEVESTGVSHGGVEAEFFGHFGVAHFGLDGAGEAKGADPAFHAAGERSMWPQRVRSLGSTLPVKESR